MIDTVFSSEGGFERSVSNICNILWQLSVNDSLVWKQLITNTPDLKMSNADLFYDPFVLAQALLDLLTAFEGGQMKWETSGYM